MIETWRLAIRNLRRNRRRNAATASAIAIGFAALLALGGYTFRAKTFLRTHAIFVKQVGHLVIHKKGALDLYATKPVDYSLPPAMQADLSRILSAHPNVDFFAGQLTGSGLVGNSCKSLPFMVTAIPPEVDAKIRQHPDMQEWTPQFIEYSKGRGLWEYPPDYGAIALSEGLARMLGKPKVVSEFASTKQDAGDTGGSSEGPLVLVDCQSPDAETQIAADANVQLLSVSWSGNMVALDGEVVAHYSTGVSETNNSALSTSLAYLQKLYDTDHVTFMSVWLKDPDDLLATQNDLQASFDKAGLSMDLYRWDNELISPMYTGTTDFLYTMVTFIAFILAIIIIFSVFNATTITIIERTQEIGMMRSLGFTRHGLRSLYLKESVVLTALAIAGGGLVGGIAFAMIKHAHIIFHPPGIAGGMQLLLAPNLSFSIYAAVGIFVLSVITTYVAIHSATKRPIPLLLSGALR